MSAALGPVLALLRSRRPRAAARLDTMRVLARSRGAIAAEVASLQHRLHAVERDAALLAAHVAALTERVEQAPEPAPSPDLEAARLAVASSYEQRIAALEDARHARRLVREENIR